VSKYEKVIKPIRPIDQSAPASSKVILLAKSFEPESSPRKLTDCLGRDRCSWPPSDFASSIKSVGEPHPRFPDLPTDSADRQRRLVTRPGSALRQNITTLLHVRRKDLMKLWPAIHQA
jgi:hypothetical protein